MPLAVAAVPAIILALVALILIYGLSFLFKSLLQSMANHVPYIGGALSSAVDAILNEAVSVASSSARAAVNWIVGFVMSPVYWIEQHIISAIETFNALIDAVAYITGSLIPGILAQIRIEISGAYNAAVAYAHAEAVSLTNLITGDVTALYRDLAAVQAGLVSYADQLFTDAEHYTQASIAAETQYVQEVASSLDHEITSAIAAETQFVTSSFNDAVHFTVTSVAAAEQSLQGEISGVTAWAGQEITALQAYIAATGAATLAYATEAVGVVEADLTNLKTECTDNLCSGLSDLASLLNALTGDLGLAALFAMAAEFATDPQGAARAVQGTLGPVAADAAGAVRSLIGV